MNQTDLLKILEAVESGKLSPGAALERLRHLPFEDLGFAKVDHHRALRQGFAEVVFAKGKTPQQVAEIVRAMLQKKDSRHNILVTPPVIAVPTSVGYGASFGGIAALLGMLNSCASNVAVVNIDNGFGAACVASCINRQ